MKDRLNENVNVNEEVKSLEEKPVVNQEEIQELKIFLEREKYTGSDGKPYWNYVVNGKFHDRFIKANFEPKDKKGYGFLDLIFAVVDKAELLMINEKMIDALGNVTRYVSYRARAIDNELNVNLVVDIKPKQKSDKSYLDLIIQLGATSKK